MSTDLNTRLITQYGVYAVPLAFDAVDLANRLQGIYTNRVMGLHWIPSAWITAVAGVNGKFQEQFGTLAVVLPAGNRQFAFYGVPSWLNTPEKKRVWEIFAEDIQRAYMAYASNEVEKGRRLVFLANANATLWAMAHNIASVLAAPVFGAQKAVTAATTTLALPALLAIGLLLAVKWKGRA